jgi:hypothetical protein
MAEPGGSLPDPLAGLSPDELARALRAMAVELERDPTLGRRISAAMDDQIPAPPTSPPSPARRRPSKTTEAATAPDADRPRTATPKPPTRTFRPRVIEGAAPDLGVGIPDPFTLRERLGEAGLRRALGELRLGTLRAMVREHRLDLEGTAVRGNDAAKLRALILQRTATR